MTAAIYVNQSRYVPYADAITRGLKPIETRTRDVLGQFVGQRVLVIRTQAGKPAAIIGSVRIVDKRFCSAAELEDLRDQTLIPPGSKFDCKGRGKWCYFLNGAYSTFQPVPLSDCKVIKKTRSFCMISDWEVK